MKAAVRSLWPDRLAAQIVVLMFGAIVFFQIVVTTAYLFSDPAWRLQIIQPSELIASSIMALDVADAEERAMLIESFKTNSPWLKFAIEPEPPANAAVIDDGPMAQVTDRLWPHAVLLAPSGQRGAPPDMFAVALHKGGYAVVTVLEPRRSTSEVPSINQRSWLSAPAYIWERSMALFLVCVGVLTIWLSGTVVRPLVDLARRAEKFPDEKAFGQVEEHGPREVRDLSRTLNRMQNRIQSMILSRSRALAAISHDLRTIITRMRLRTEFIVDDSLKSKMLHDVELMDSMLHKNLLYLKGEQESAERSLIDLDSVLQTIADDYADLGHTVVYTGGGRQTVYGSLTELQRLFSNLVENAVKHGTQTTIRAKSPVGGYIQVEIADNGPGIPEDQRERVLEPFVRGEPARTVSDRSGFGLGLSIVQSLVEKAGGRIELAQGKPRGLIARVALPAAFP